MVGLGWIRCFDRVRTFATPLTVPPVTLSLNRIQKQFGCLPPCRSQLAAGSPSFCAADAGDEFRYNRLSHPSQSHADTPKHEITEIRLRLDPVQRWSSLLLDLGSDRPDGANDQADPARSQLQLGFCNLGFQDQLLRVLPLALLASTRCCVASIV